MKGKRIAMFLIILAAWQWMPFEAAAQGDGKKETVLDRKAHIEDTIHLDLPEVPRLCDGMEIEKQRINVGNCTLYCEIEGRGTPLVLINGGPGGTHHYFHPCFSRAKEFAKVIYYDQRGCGLSDYKPGKGYTVKQAARDLDQLREALNLDQWVLLGHSYGGFLAQFYALEYPDRVAGLVLVCASTGMHRSLGSRQYDYQSREERRRIQEIHNDPRLTAAQSVYNAFLNGDWKRQSFYKPSREDIARKALYEWTHDRGFNAIVNGSINRQEDMTGIFDRCPIPTIIMEGKWDLTWGEEKARAFHGNHPGSKLVMFDQSSHNPFEDEPKKFFDALEKFVTRLQEVNDRKLDLWKKDLDERREAIARREEDLKKTPAYFIRSLGWGRKSNEQMVERYSKKQLNELKDAQALLKLGFALYDYEKYEEALAVFRKRQELAGGDRLCRSVSLIWQGHVLDLMKRRKEAVAAYQAAAVMKLNSLMSHSQFGLTYVPHEYAAERMKTPFMRLENRYED